MTKYGDDDKVSVVIVGVFVASALVSLTVAAVIVWAVVKVVSALT